MAISKNTFRTVMSRWATGVTVISARHGDQTHGMVASSFASLSTDPISVLFCADHKTRTYSLVKAAGAFAVNILSQEQERAFRVFAGWSDEIVEDKFAGEPTIAAPTGSPILQHCLAWLDCRVVAEYPGGNTHSIFVGEVVEGDAGEGVDHPPLIYFNRKLHRLTSDD